MFNAGLEFGPRSTWPQTVLFCFVSAETILPFLVIKKELEALIVY